MQWIFHHWICTNRPFFEWKNSILINKLSIWWQHHFIIQNNKSNQKKLTNKQTNTFKIFETSKTGNFAKNWSTVNQVSTLSIIYWRDWKMLILWTTQSVLSTYVNKNIDWRSKYQLFNQYYQLGETMWSTTDVNQLSTKHSSAQHLLYNFKYQFNCRTDALHLASIQNIPSLWGHKINNCITILQHHDDIRRRHRITSAM